MEKMECLFFLESYVISIMKEFIMKNIILFRNVGKKFFSELETAKKIFDVYENMTMIPNNSLVIGRYSVLPFYLENWNNLSFKNCKLINDPQHHNYISKFWYYHDIEDYTFKSWFRLEDIPLDMRNQRIVVKGETNSKKFLWKDKMLAKDFSHAVEIANDLRNDYFFEYQDLIFRQYVPLQTFEVGMHDLPFSNEWRIFFLNGQYVSHGFYWTIADQYENAKNQYEEDFKQNGLQFALEVSKLIRVPFYAMDIAKTEKGDWVVVEINDGQMSGLCDINQQKFYSSLCKVLENPI